MATGDKGRARLMRQARARLYRIVEDGTCILCGEPACVVGAWTASTEVSRQLGAAPGKRRMFGYMLCGRCVRLPDPSTRIEDIIIARWQRATAGACPN